MTHSPALTLARAHIVWLAFGECRSPGWDGPPPSALEALAAIDAELAASADAGRLVAELKQTISQYGDRPDSITYHALCDAVNELAALARPAPADGLTTLTVETRHPQDYTLHNAGDGTTWRGTAGGQWVAEPASAQGDERGAFESWIAKRETPFTNWQLWQAARAQVAQGDEVDAARLDWLEQAGTVSLGKLRGKPAPDSYYLDTNSAMVNGKTLREAIDAARAQQGGQR